MTNDFRDQASFRLKCIARTLLAPLWRATDIGLKATIFCNDTKHTTSEKVREVIKKGYT